MGKSEGLLDMFKRTRLQILNIKHKAPLYEKASKPNPVKTPSQITPSLGLGFKPTQTLYERLQIQSANQPPQLREKPPSSGDCLSQTDLRSTVESNRTNYT